MIDQVIETLYKLNQEYVSTHDFIPRKEAYKIWNEMTPTERRMMCLSCFNSKRTKKNNLLRTKEICYMCEAGLRFSK